MWIDSWAENLRVLIVGSVSYTALVLLLRIAGKRTLGRLNAFDFIVTVAFGSTLAAILPSGLSDIAAVVLEANGAISVIPEGKFGNGSALKGVVTGPASEPS